MKKALISAIIVVALLLAAAAGVVVYMERKNGDQPSQPGAVGTESAPAETQQDSQNQENSAQETTEETVGISLPTEDPSEVGPAYTWPEDEEGTAETVAPVDPDATYDPDENETPPMGA